LTREILFAALIACVAASPAAADVVLDGSFGTEGPVQPGLDPDWQLTDHLIEERFGRLAGTNLFHSFREFSVPVGKSATFTSISPVENVIARVTGGSASAIDGALRSTIDGADLFVLNPSGVIFGPEASLDLRGSFHVSTADALVFPDLVWPSGEAGDSVLSVEPPSAFGFLGADPAPIRFDHARLSVPDGSTFSAVGGDIRVAGRRFSTVPALKALGGRIQLASVASRIDVPIDVASLDVEPFEPEALGEVVFTERAVLDVSEKGGRGSGRVVIRSGRFVMEGGRISALAKDYDGDPTAIDVAVAGDLEVGGAALIQSSTSGGARGGNIQLAGGTVELTDKNSLVAVLTKASAAGGEIQIRADELVVSSEAVLLTRSDSSSTVDGDAGRIHVDVERVALSNGGRIVSESKGAGAGGGIEVIAQALTVMSEAKISSLSQADGEGGAIQIEAANVTVTDSGQVASETRGSSTGGIVDVTAGELSVTEGGQVTTLAAENATGRGGDLQVDADRVLVSTGDFSPVVAQIGALTASVNGGAGGDLSLSVGSLELRDGGQIRTTTEGTGPAGGLEIHATDAVRASGTATVIEGDREEFVPSGLFARSARDATGSGGRLFVDAKTVEVDNGAEISARTFGSGNAGELEIRGSERVSISGGPKGQSVVSARGLDGEGGDLTITTDVLELLEGGQVTASTVGSGDSGDVTIDARSVLISGADPLAGNPSGVFAQTNARVIEVPDGGDAGDISMTASEGLRILDGGRVSVASRGAGASGNITIGGGGVLELAGGAEISAWAESTGRAGSIMIGEMANVTLSDGGTITAQSTGSGDAGDITINAGQRLVLRGRSSSDRSATSISTRAENAFGGNIRITATQGVEVNNGEISTSVRAGTGDGGNISIDPEFVVLNHSDITAQADVGNGGNIRIETENFVQSADSVVDASSRLGISGKVEITAPDADLSADIVTLPESFLDASSLLRQSCSARTARAGSLVVRGRDRIPASPDAPLRGFYLGGREQTW
jgi:filamentous hemagglutinin family protein